MERDMLEWADPRGFRPRGLPIRQLDGGEGGKSGWSRGRGHAMHGASFDIEGGRSEHGLEKNEILERERSNKGATRGIRNYLVFESQVSEIGVKQINVRGNGASNCAQEIHKRNRSKERRSLEEYSKKDTQSLSVGVLGRRLKWDSEGESITT